MLALPASAFAGEFSFKQETGVSIPLTEPQSDVYGIGASHQIKALWSLTPYLDLGPTGSFMFLPAKADGAASGVAWGFGGGLRVKRPHDAVTYHSISPWIDADALYVRTGDLHRPGFDVGVGASMPIDRNRNYWVGPFARYQHVVSRERSGYDTRDAKTLTLGLTFEISVGREKHADPGPDPTPAPTPVAAAAPAACPDGDNDGLRDDVDHCPEVAGPADLWGCPPYKKVVVKKDKLELREKLYFDQDKATLQDISYEVLDDVVQALKDNKGFRVQVEGHTSSEGTDAHNQTLSEKRAETVLDYLVKKGIGKERLVFKGFASSVPVDTNKTEAGRENNRRVEFIVNFIILKDGAKK